MNYFPDEVLEHVFDYVTSHQDRNAVSLVCKLWYRVERFSRAKVFVGNCYAISPERVIARFPGVKSLTIKGKPHFADFNLVPHDWGGDVHPWVQAFAKRRIALEELRLKRMVVTDDSLELLSRSFPNFKALLLFSCEGFTTNGLAAIASNCRYQTNPPRTLFMRLWLERLRSCLFLFLLYIGFWNSCSFCCVVIIDL